MVTPTHLPPHMGESHPLQRDTNPTLPKSLPAPVTDFPERFCLAIILPGLQQICWQALQDGSWGKAHTGF